MACEPAEDNLLEDIMGEDGDFFFGDYGNIRGGGAQPLHNHGFGDGRRGGQAQSCGELAIGGRSVQHQFGILGMADDQRVESGGIG